MRTRREGAGPQGPGAPPGRASIDLVGCARPLGAARRRLPARAVAASSAFSTPHRSEIPMQRTGIALLLAAGAMSLLAGCDSSPRQETAAQRGQAGNYDPYPAKNGPAWR